MVDFAGTGESGKENRHALFVARRITASQFLHHFRIGKPTGNIAAFIQPLAQFGAGNIQHARALGHFVIRIIFIFIFQIDHHVERHHGHADVRLVLLENLLSLIGAVERLSVGIFARAGMIAAHNEVRAAVVLANQCVPDRLARPSHAHRQGQQGKLHGSLRIFGGQQLVTAHPGEIVHVARFGHSHHRMDQEIGLHLLGRAETQFLMSPVHGVASLKGNDPAPAQPGEFGPKFSRGKPQRAEVVMRGQLQALDAAARHTTGWTCSSRSPRRGGLCWCC